MDLIGPQIGARHAFTGLRQCLFHIALVQHHTLYPRVVADRLLDIIHVGQFLIPGFPGYFQRLGSLHGLFFSQGNHTHEVTNHHHFDDARNMRDGRLVHLQQAVADKLATVQPGIGRADHPAMQHVRQAHVMHIDQLARGFGGDIHPGRGLAHQSIVLHRLERCIPGNAQHMALVLDQAGERTLAAVGAFDNAVFHQQGIRLYTQLLCGPGQQKTPRFSGCVAQRDRRDLNGGAGDGCALIRCAIGIPQHHAHLLQCQIQLFGHDLRQ